ncbi:MAG: hypothetical protein RLZZ429_2170 [Bacteroidota bacterium]
MISQESRNQKITDQEITDQKIIDPNDTRTNQKYEGPCGGPEEVSLTSIIVITK